MSSTMQQFSSDMTRRVFVKCSLAFVAAFVVIGPKSTLAKQLQYKTVKNPNFTTFFYNITNYQNNIFELSFDIHNDIINELPFLRHDDSFIQKRVRRAKMNSNKSLSENSKRKLKNLFKKIEEDYLGLSIKPIHRKGKFSASYIFDDFSKMNDMLLREEIDIRIKAVIENYKYEDRSASAEVDLLDDAENKVYRKFGLKKYRVGNGTAYITPDYPSVVVRYVDKLQPLANALLREFDDNDVRALVDNTLAFFQSIPYDILLDRRASPGAGFATPIGLIKVNKGDCDTKSAAFLSVMAAMSPKIRKIFVLLPTHALVGLEIPPKSKDFTTNFGGRTYVLMEPTGPALLPSGVIGTNSASEIRGKQNQKIVSI